jgi:Zn-dependent protease with chaperone function
VSLAVCLLFYGSVLCVVAPRLLPYLVRGDGAPRLAVAVWFVVLAGVLASWAGAAASLVVHVVRTWNRPDPLAVQACLAEVRSAAGGHSGVAMQVGLAVTAMVLSGFIITLGARAGRSLVRARAATRRHARSARIVGRRVDGVDGLVVDAVQKIAYCLGGRCGTVVITSAAVAALHRPQLEAVLTHERAHLAGRHHLLLAVTRALAASLPQVRLFTAAEAEVARLVEMCADDVAARRHSAGTVISAILALAGVDPIPAVALGASSVGVYARVARLADPGTAALRRRAGLLMAAVTGIIVLAPLLLVWAATSGLPACGPFTA